jgi:hypothetical protein
MQELPMNRLGGSARQGLVCHDQTRLQVWKGQIVGTIIVVVASLHIGSAMANERQAILASRTRALRTATTATARTVGGDRVSVCPRLAPLMRNIPRDQSGGLDRKRL